MGLKGGKPFIEKFAKLSQALQKQHTFVLSVGDEGALLTYIRKGEVEHFLTASLSAQEELKAMQEFMALHHKVPVSIMIDVIDQAYTQHTLPGVNAMSIPALAQRKLQKDFAATDLKSCIQLKRLPDGRKDWQYLYVNAPFASPLSDWINLVMKTPNPFGGMFMLPLETRSLLARLQAAVFVAGGEKQPSAYQILLTHNKVSGFRQTAFKEGNVLFSRVVDASVESSPEGSAASIEQELKNALEYLRRLSFQQGDALDLYIIVAEEVKQHLVSMNLAGKNVVILTPFETANLLKLNNAVTPSARFADILIAAAFAAQKPVLPFYTKQTEKFAALEKMHKYALFATLLLVPVLFLMIGIASISLASLSGEVDQAARAKSQLEDQWGSAQKENGFSVSESYKILELVALHKLLSDNSPSPFEILGKFKEVQGTNVIVRTVEWATKDPQGQPGAGGQPSPQNAPGGAAPLLVQAAFDVELYNNGGGNKLEGIIEQFDMFTKKLKEEFPNYTVGYSNLPEKLNLDMQNASLPVKVSIAGPKDPQ